MLLQSIPSSHIFKNNFANNNPIDKEQLRLKPPLLKDEVFFCANKAPKLPKEKILSAILKKSKMDFASISETKSVMIKKIIGKDKTKNIKAYMIKAKGTKEKIPNTFLGVFSKDGDLLGHINRLDSEEYYADDFASKFNLGKYLRLHDLDCSYQNEYRGVGTALIEKAKDESKHLNLDGQLKVFAFNNFDKRRNSPVPFYAKKGFISAKNPSKTKEELIKEFTTTDAVSQPCEMYLLTPENESKFRKPTQLN